MLAIFYALMPIFLLIVVGWFFHRKQFPSKGFWASADRLSYFVLLPALIVHKLAVATYTTPHLGIILGTMCGVVIGVGLLSLTLAKLRGISATSITSVFQGSIRPNTYVVLAASSALFGSDGMALAIIGLAGVIPLVNVLCILVFAYFVPNGKRSFAAIIKNVMSNPLVVACVLGLLLNITGIGLPFFTSDLLAILASAALPLGLISVGTGLKPLNKQTMVFPILISSTLKILIMPVLVYITLQYFDVSRTRSSRLHIVRGRAMCSFLLYFGWPSQWRSTFNGFHHHN